MVDLQLRNMLILQENSNLTSLEQVLHKGYKNLVSKIVKISCNSNSTIDPFTSEYIGKNSDKPSPYHYDALLEITSYFWASKGGRGTLLEKALKALAGDSAEQGKFLSDSLDQLIKSDKMLVGKTSSKLHKKFDLINIVGDSLIILELKNRVDSGGTSARKEALEKFFLICDCIDQDIGIFVDNKTNKEYTLPELLKNSGIKNLEMLMGFFYSNSGTTAKIEHDKKGFYAESKSLISNYEPKNLEITKDSDNLKINFNKCGVKVTIQTIYGNDVPKRFTKTNKPLTALFQKVFLKSWDDIWLALNVGIRQRDFLLKYKTNHVLIMQNLYKNDTDFKLNLDEFKVNSNNLTLLTGLVDKINYSGGGVRYLDHLYRILQTVCMYVRGLHHDHFLDHARRCICHT